jgi:hypothetical protein
VTTNTPVTNGGPGTARRSPSVAARRFGYALAILINGAFLWVINVWPTWEALPWLTPSTTEVIPWINASIIVGMVANAVYLLVDPRWLRALGDVVTTSVGLAAMLQVWAVFPFDFGNSTVPWALLTRILIAIAVFGSVIAIVVQAVTFVREIVKIGTGR